MFGRNASLDDGIFGKQRDWRNREVDSEHADVWLGAVDLVAPERDAGDVERIRRAINDGALVKRGSLLSRSVM